MRINNNIRKFIPLYIYIYIVFKLHKKLLQDCFNLTINCEFKS